MQYCQFRCSEEGEIVGVDEDQCGEWACSSFPPFSPATSTDSDGADDYACLQRDLEGNYRSSPDELMEHEQHEQVQQQHGSETTEEPQSFEAEVKHEKPAVEAVVV